MCRVLGSIVHTMQWMGLRMLWNGSEKDGNVRSEREEDEGTDCDDGGSDTEWYRQTVTLSGTGRQ